MKKYDVIVIGTGAGNIITDAALDSGLKVAQIEKGKFGGTCLTKGCIPTKVMVSVADFIRESQKVNKIGIEIGEAKVNWDLLTTRVWAKINESKDILNEYLQEENLDVYQGTGFFIEDKVLKVQYFDGSFSEAITAEIIVIAAGARSRILNIKGLNEAGFITSEEFFGSKWPSKPYDSLAIIGAGAIGCEFAHFFSSVGTKVSLISKGALLPKADADISKQLNAMFNDLAIDLKLDYDILEVSKVGNQKLLKLKFNDTIEEILVDEILMAAGLVSNSDILKLTNTNIKLTADGWIKTNEFLETSVKGVYAIGDINGYAQLRHKANYEADILVNNLFPKAVALGQIDLENVERRFVSYENVPSVVYTYPQVAQIGYSEKEARSLAKANNWDIRVGYQNYSETAKGYAMGYEENDIDDGFVKVIIDVNSKRILGVHIIGEQASVLLQPFVSLMMSGDIKLKVYNEDIGFEDTLKLRKQGYTRYLDPKKITSITETMVAHPSLSEVVMWTQYFVPMK